MEITIYIFLLVSLILNGILFYRGYKLVEQIEKYQQQIINVENETIDTLEKMLSEMKEIDLKGSFESDDEVGVVFKELKDIIERYKKNA